MAELFVRVLWQRLPKGFSYDSWMRAGVQYLPRLVLKMLRSSFAGSIIKYERLFLLLKHGLDFRLPAHLLAYELNVSFLREEGNMLIIEGVF